MFHVKTTCTRMKLCITILLFITTIISTFGKPHLPLSRYTRSISNQSVLPPTFGSAKLFQPIPSAIIGAHCEWEIIFNTVPNRIPQTITEIVCQQPNSVCGGNHAYQCHQIRSKMLVGYTEGDSLMDLRNMTFNIGCSCVRRSSNLVSFLIPTRQRQKRGGRRNMKNLSIYQRKSK